MSPGPCPDMLRLSLADQQQLARELAPIAPDSQIIKVIEDDARLRAQARICHEY